jgi:hypothetical protein
VNFIKTCGLKTDVLEADFTGKSFVLQEIIGKMEMKYSADHYEGPLPKSCGCFHCNVAVTAPTGIAGWNWNHTCPSDLSFFVTFGRKCIR